MNKKIKKLWIDALRSGKYKQGREYMRRDDADGVTRYCCLGVLEEIRCSRVSGTRFSRPNEVLANVTRKWAGLNESNPPLGRGNAASLNDAGKGFKFIANMIEKYL